MKARIELKVGELQIQAGDGSKVYDLDLHYNELGYTPEVDFERNGDRSSLKINLEGEGTSFINSDENRMNLHLHPDVELDLESNTGVGESDLNLTGMKISRLVLHSGVGETRLAMLEANQTSCELVEVVSGVGELDVIGLGNFNFSRLRFKGGIGESTLEFSGDWDEIGSVSIEVGVGEIDILIPRDIGAELTVSKGLFSDYDIDGFTKRGDVFFSDNMDRVDKTVQIEVRSGLGEVNVRWI
jgi:hypothetical protein